VVAPISERYLGMIRALFSPDTKKRPTLIPIESAGAIAAVAKAYESYDLPKGTIRGSPAIPDDDLTTLRVPLYLVAKPAIDERVVGKLTRAIMDVRRDLVSEFPLLAQIAAPSTDKDAQIQIHPGAAAYFGGEEKSIFDTYGDWYFYGTLLLGTLTSGLAAVWKFLIADPNGTKSSPIERLHRLTARIRDAKSEPELEEIEEEISRILQEELTRLSDEDSKVQALNVTITRLEHLIAQRSRRFHSADWPGPASEQPAAPPRSA
jgi:hypothetical protein